MFLFVVEILALFTYVALSCGKSQCLGPFVAIGHEACRVYCLCISTFLPYTKVGLSQYISYLAGYKNSNFFISTTRTFEWSSHVTVSFTLHD